MNWLRRLFRRHVHEWGEPECRIMNVTDETGNVRASRHGHVKWCDTCGDYTMVYGVKCLQPTTANAQQNLYATPD